MVRAPPQGAPRFGVLSLLHATPPPPPFPPPQGCIPPFPTHPPPPPHSPPPLPPTHPPADTYIIFDWDDTLLSSSWVAHRNIHLDESSIVPPDAVASLTSLSESVITLLMRAKRQGRVAIITNAETGWVELSCKKFMPKAWATVSSIRVLSARSTYERRAKDSPSEWKTLAFQDEVAKAYSGRHPLCTRNVLSFGDSIHERQAILKVTTGLGPSTRSKSIKFVERPTVEQLKRQVDLVTSCIEEIIRHDGPLDLMLTISLNGPGLPGGGGGVKMGGH